MKCFTYTEMKTGQEQFVSDMVWEVFEEFVAPGYSPDGIETFENIHKHPEHAEMKAWSRYWTLELREWERKPKVIYI